MFMNMPIMPFNQGTSLLTKRILFVRFLLRPGPGTHRRPRDELKTLSKCIRPFDFRIDVPR